MAGSLAGTGALALGCADEPDLVGGCELRCAQVGAALRIGVSELAGRLGDPDLQSGDLRTDSAGVPGIPGALPLAIGELLRTVDEVPSLIVEPAELERALQEAGLVAGRQTVAYADPGQLAAARMLWSLALHDDFEWRLLDGGLAAWVDAGEPTASVADSRNPGDWRAAGFVDLLRTDADWVEANLDAPDVVLVDARSASEYASGHIPGAVNVEWRANLDDDDQLRSADEVLGLLPELSDETAVVTYCQTGQRASMAWFALRYAGRVDVRLYDGSWADWSRDPNRPRAMG